MITIKTILAFLKLNKWIMYLLVIGLFIGFGMYLGAKIWRAEMQRMDNNYLATLEQIRNENNNNMRVLNLTVAEIKQQYPEIKQALKDMDIKLKNVVAAQNVNTVTNTTVNTIVKDSVINDTVIAKVAHYNDKWTDFKLTMIKDSIHSSIVTRDSLFIVLNKVPRNFWQWLSAEPRNVRSTVKNYNPNSKITYNRLIQIK